MRHQHNPEDKPPEPVKRKLGIKNWLILGVAGFGGYWLFKNVIKKQLDSGALKSALSSGKTSGPDVNGPMVSQGEIASTQSQTCISSPVPGYSYAPISSVNQFTGYKTFSATVTGHFTRRLLCMGGKQWAEIKPGV